MDHNHLNLSVVIVGGSVAGMAAAILLRRLKLNVVILERSSQPLTGRGAGIILPESLLQQCIALDLFDKDIPALNIANRSFNTKNKKIWQQAMTASVAFNWSHIYDNLYRRLPAGSYHYGIDVNAVSKINEQYVLQTTQGKTYHADWVIAADGINSIVREKFFPEIERYFTGYVAWRGVVNDDALINKEVFKKNVPYFVFHGGHLLLYYIPALDYQATGRVSLNWLLYENCPTISLEKFLIDKTGMSQSVFLSPGSLSENHLNHLHHFASQVLPKEMAEIILKTEKPFLQPIFDLLSPAHVKEKCCFIGDAAAITRPHSVSGVLKGLMDSITLAEHLKHAVYEQNDFLNLLNQWNETQINYSRTQVKLSQTMGEALVTKSPQWETMTPDLMDAWWKKVMENQSWYATKD